MTGADRMDALEAMNTIYGMAFLHAVAGQQCDFHELVHRARMSRSARFALLDQYRAGLRHGREVVA